MADGRRLGGGNAGWQMVIVVILLACNMRAPFTGVGALTALIHCGDMGILSMAIPCVCRMGRGADFRKVCLWSACLGGSILLFCRSVCSMIYVAGMAMPVNFAISLVVLPAFVLAISKQRSAFE